ncbi:VWA domain-containing protein [Reichenbachiella sp.]|uniref:VWA domain-containing protein n=1 Tax=Reichenbachiella sp. TaxID=2184521 RepID=UPI003B5A6E8F
MRSASLNLPNYQKAITYTALKARKASFVKRSGLLRKLFFGIIWLLMVATLTNPRLVGKPEMKVKVSRNFLIVADISFSMAQKDWEVNGEKTERWHAVKSVMHEFIEKRRGDRMGLIFFGSNAYIQAPFTPDLETVNQMLEEADVGMAGQITHIGKAITKGVELFENDTIKTRVMLLLTDGIDAGTDILPLDAAALAKKDSVMIYTIGIGTPGNKGSDLDEKTLQEIAELTGGQYFLAKDNKRLQEIYAELDKMEPMEFEEEKNKPVTLLYMYPLYAALSLMLLLTFVVIVMDLINAIRSRKESYVQ